jgi:hypothetical protein
MKPPHVLFVIAGFAVLAAAGVAVAANMTSSRHSDFYSPGRHQFYVWCAGGKDSVEYQDGANAEDAQAKLYAAEKSAGAKNCWPVWQGRISS